MPSAMTVATFSHGPQAAALHAQSTAVPNMTWVEVNTSALLDRPAGVNTHLLFYSFFINVYVDGLLCTFGYFGNILTIIVLQRDKVQTSNVVFLQALAVFDNMLLTYVVFYVVLRSIPPYTGAISSYATINPYIVAIVLPFGWIAQTCTIWIVMVIAIDRYLVVSRPIEAKLWCTKKNARKVVICVFIAAMLFNLPRWPHYYYVAFDASGANSDTTFVSHLTFKVTFWDENLYRQLFHQALGFIFLFIIPLSIIITLNVLLVIIIKNAIKDRQAMTNQLPFRGSKKETDSNMNLNIIMVIMISTFVVCELPDFIASIIGVTNTVMDPEVYKYFAPVKECLLVLNSAINFYIYCVFYKRFRNTLTSMLSCTQEVQRSSVQLPAATKPLSRGTSLSSFGSQQTLSSNLSASLQVIPDDVKTVV